MFAIAVIEILPCFLALPFLSFAGMIGLFCGGILLDLIIQAFICSRLIAALNRLPPEYRKQQPVLVWLLLIPLVRLVWNFFVFPKIQESYRAYWDAQIAAGQVNVQDPRAKAIISELGTLQSLSLAFCICACLLVIPHFWACIYLPILILEIILLVKMGNVCRMIKPMP